MNSAPVSSITGWLQDDAKSTLDQFKMMISSANTEEEIVRYELMRRLDLCFVHEQKSLYLLKTLFVDLIDKAQTSDEFILYTENFLKVLSIEIRKHKPDDQQRFERLAATFDAYFQKHLHNAQLETLDKQSNQAVKALIITTASSIAGPVSGMAGQIAGPLIYTADKINTVRQAAIHLGMHEKTKLSRWEQFKAGVKKVGEKIKLGVGKLWTWTKKNPVKAVAAGLAVAAIITLPFVFLPFIAAVGIVSLGIGMAKLLHQGYQNQAAYKEAVARVGKFENILQDYHGPEPDEKMSHDHQLSSTALIDKREGVDPHHALVDDVQAQHDLSQLRGLHLLDPLVDHQPLPEKNSVKKNDSKYDDDEEKDSPPGEKGSHPHL